VFFGASAEGRADELRHELASTTDYPIERVWWLPEEELIRWLSEKAGGAEWRQGRMDTLVALIHDEVRIEGGEWPWEALTHFELYPDTCVVGGLLVRPTERLILSAGQYLGLAEVVKPLTAERHWGASVTSDSCESSTRSARSLRGFA